MRDIILKVENVSKQYQLGTFGTKTIGGDVHRWWTTKVLGKEDPFLKVGEVNDRTSKEKADFVWALKDINFEVKRGEVLGIIGRNGAGKSTLLKLLSRVTSPTTGTIKIAGRMASLLEVGTGFHPELTGRENIFLNGAILGMSKKEIQSKFDEIVDFSGCDLYVDTPVKRYSSGMKVRLGFAVAAFLDPEILIVDEVLAVGDAEFQKRAMGKLQDVSKSEGRTVLFVSHNMASIKQLCASSIFLKNGQIVDIGETKKIISNYLVGVLENKYYFKDDDAIITLIEILNENIFCDEVVLIKINLNIKKIDCRNDAIEVFFWTTDGVLVFHSICELMGFESGSVLLEIPGNLLNSVNYSINIGISSHYSSWKEKHDNVLNFKVTEKYREIKSSRKWEGIVRPKLKFTEINYGN
jgi:lipopolysaccharide transport system ATP-binding protein